jgi:hypothetical protein
MRPPFLPLFLIAAATLGFEVALIRFFAVAHFSEYAYWVLSISMTGFAFSGVFLSLFKVRAEPLLKGLPLFLLASCALGYLACGLIPFNALELQHPGTFWGQLWNIGLFYGALFPFFFGSGLYVGLCLTRFSAEAARLYAGDLLGAGFGCALLLGAMWLLPPFRLPAVLLPLLALAAWRSGARWSALILCAVLEAALFFANPARVSEYKPLSYALLAPDAQITEHWVNPRGEFHVLRSPSERLDVDLSNNAAAHGVEEVPVVEGLYQDGVRIAGIYDGVPAPDPKNCRWFQETLDAIPFEFCSPHSAILGMHGTFITCGFSTACTRVPLLFEAQPDLGPRTGGTVRQFHFGALEGSAPLDLINVDPEFAALDKFALSVEALRLYEGKLAPTGLLAVPASIQDNAVPAARVLAQLVEAFGREVGRRTLIYHSAWGVRFLVFKHPPSAKTVAAVAKRLDGLSFDLSWAAGLPLPGHDPYNELGSLAYPGGEAGEAELKDALASEAALAFAQGWQAMASAKTCDLRPATLDRPFLSSSLRLDRLSEAFANLGLLPREELPLLVNLAVLAQSLLLALLVLLLPALAGKGLGLSWADGVRHVYYFSALGLGFLFFEVSLIDKVAPYLQDKALAFSLVLTCLLLASGGGSYVSGRLGPRLWLPFAGIAAWFLAYASMADPALLFLGGLRPWAQMTLLALWVAPLGFFLGMPFPLGLRRSAAQTRPWAWAINGAASVLAPPLAFLLAREQGYKAVALAALLLYVLAFFSLPRSDAPKPA